MARSRKPLLKTTTPRNGKVTVTMLPVVKCNVCGDSMAYRPTESAGEVLTRHWEQRHSS